MSKSRNEKILENILGAENELDEPRSRNEKLLKQILDQSIIIGDFSVSDDGNGTVTIHSEGDENA